jgi:hypothetical protein
VAALASANRRRYAPFLRVRRISIRPGTRRSTGTSRAVARSAHAGQNTITGDDPMRKLTLNLDALTVDSFPTSPREAAAIGTVHAREDQQTLNVVCTISTLATNPTCCPCTP